MGTTEVIYYPVRNTVDEKLCTSLGILYDRVIIPFLDIAHSSSEWGRDFLEHCELIRAKELEYLLKGKCPICKPLTAEDTPLVNYDKYQFHSELLSYAERNGITEHEWHRVLEMNRLGLAYTTLNCMLSESILTRREEQMKETKFLVVADCDNSHCQRPCPDRSWRFVWLLHWFIVYATCDFVSTVASSARSLSFAPNIHNGNLGTATH